MVTGPSGVLGVPVAQLAVSAGSENELAPVLPNPTVVHVEMLIT